MANELIYSATSTTRVPISVASICGMRKQEHTDPTTLIVDYRIVFTMPHGSNIIWSFTTALARDGDFATILATYGFNAG